MFRSAAERRRSARARGLTGLLLLLALGSSSSPLAAQRVVATGVELTPATRQSLERLQDLWLQWVAAFYQGRPEAAAKVVDELASAVHQLGFSRLPDLARAMSVRALEAADKAEFARAEAALAGAERLDPGDPGLAFARAHVERRQGKWGAALASVLRGYRQLWRQPLERSLALLGLESWLAAVLLLAAALFLLLLVAVHGSAIYLDLHRLLARRLPRRLAGVACCLLLLWPLLLPGGPVWLLLYWSALLFGYARLSERVVLASLWALIAAAPLYVDFRIQRMAIDLSPPMRALAAVNEGRLYGSLFSDLGVLSAALPAHAGVAEVLADLHRGLGQWEQAQLLYREVIEAEPQNVAALVNLGAHYFRRGDFAAANQYFQRAALIEPPSAEAYFNLSLAHSEAYLFDESRRALERARELDDAAVNSWLARGASERVVTLRGAAGRYLDLRNAIDRAWRGERAARTLGGLELERLGLFAVLAFAALGALSRRLRGVFGSTDVTGWLGDWSPRAERIVRSVLPPWSMIEEGQGGRAFLSLLALAALLSAGVVDRLSFRVPWSVAAPGLPLGWLALLAVAAWLYWRLRRLRSTVPRRLSP